MTNKDPIHDGELAARISNTVVRALSRTTGRGPTKAKTTLGPNGVFVVLQDTLTRGEQTLADAGQSEAVLDLRHRWQMIMKNDVSREIEELTGRKVIGFMSDNHIDPDLALKQAHGAELWARIVACGVRGWGAGLSVAGRGVFWRRVDVSGVSLVSAGRVFGVADAEPVGRLCAARVGWV